MKTKSSGVSLVFPPAYSVPYSILPYSAVVRCSWYKASLYLRFD